MTQKERTYRLLSEHFHRYPKMQTADLFKFLYQSAFGCEHLVVSWEEAVAYIEKEYKTMEHSISTAAIEPLDGAYCRVPLTILKGGILPETLGTLFCRSAKHEENGKEALLEKLEVAMEMVENGVLPFSGSEFTEAIEAWRAEGFTAVHHSHAFRDAYHPAYRVIAKEYVAFLPLFSRIDRLLSQKGRAIIAIEGGSACGKTTLARLLEEIYGCTVFHADDFFLRPEQRTPERFAEVGGNLDRERLLEEILKPLRDGKEVVSRRFDCSTQTLDPPISVTPTPLTVVEGAYSMHPELASYYDLSAFLEIDPDYQRERILKRNSPQLAKRFFDEWIPLERIYFEGTGAASHCDLVIPIRSDDFVPPSEKSI